MGFNPLTQGHPASYSPKNRRRRLPVVMLGASGGSFLRPKKPGATCRVGFNPPHPRSKCGNRLGSSGTQGRMCRLVVMHPVHRADPDVLSRIDEPRPPDMGQIRI